MMNRKDIKMCQSCRGLIAANAAVCPLCGNESHYAGGRSIALSSNWSLNTILLTVNVIVYVVVMAWQVRVWGLPVESSGMHIWPPDSRILDIFGAVRPDAVLNGQYWRLLTMCFLHSGILHLGFNSYALLQIGREAEEAYGKAKYLCLYLTAGICGSLAVVAVGQSAVGASGAVFGVIGAMAVYGHKRGDLYGRVLKSSMVQWLIYGLVISFMPGISMAAHVGGLIGGAGMAYLMSDAEQMRQSLRQVRLWQLVATATVVLLLGSFAMAALNVRWITAARAIHLMAVPVFNASNAYKGWQQAEDAEDFETYRRFFGSTVTTLEHTKAVDEESAALQQRMLDILRPRRDQLNQAANLAAAPIDPAQREAFERVSAEYEDWVRRKSRSLEVPEEIFLRPQRN
jgi:rhomboid protease GluP